MQQVDPYGRSSLVPIVIGITGHRNPSPEIISELEIKFAAILKRIDESAPNSPMVLLSPLAVGCDRLAARIALNFPRIQGIPIELVVPMPLALDDYRKDFEKPTDLEEFEHWRARAAYEFVLPPFPGATDEHGCIAGEMRDAHYRRMGLYVALQSQVMVAMWDGVRNNKVGGTGDIVDFCNGKTTRSSSRLTENATPEQRAAFAGIQIPLRPTMPLLAQTTATPILILPTRRDNQGEVAAEALDREKKNAEVLDNICEAFGDSVERLNIKLSQISQDSIQWRSEFRDQFQAPLWGVLVARFERLDALANTSKNSYSKDAKIIAWLAVFAIICFQVFSSFNDAWPAVACYVILLGSSGAVWWYSTRKKCEWLFVHARGLAEALRVQLAWSCAGIQELVADHYFARRSQEIEFIRSQLRAAALEIAAGTQWMEQAQIEHARLAWVEDQLRYFKPDAGGMKSRTYKDVRGVFLKKWSVRISLVLAIGLGVLVAFRDLSSGKNSDLLGYSMDTIVSAGCLIVGSFFALTVGIDYLRGIALHREELDIASRMLPIFEQANSKLRQAKSHSDGIDVLRGLGKEALDENAEWLSRHKGRLQIADAG